MMGRSTAEVSTELLDEFIKNAKPCGYEYLGKIGYKKETKTYLVSISGPLVPNVPKVTGIFTRKPGASGLLSVEFTPVND